MTDRTLCQCSGQGLEQDSVQLQALEWVLASAQGSTQGCALARAQEWTPEWAQRMALESAQGLGPEMADLSASKSAQGWAPASAHGALKSAWWLALELGQGLGQESAQL